MARAVAKYLTARSVEAAAEAAAKKDDGVDKMKKRKDDDGNRAAGMLARFLANATTTVLERADTRAWSLLPSSVSVVRMRIPAGTHELIVEAAGTRQLSLPGVVIRGGRTTVVSARLFQEPSQGIRAMTQRTAGNETPPER